MDGTTFTFTQQDNDHYAWSDITGKPSYYDAKAVTSITRSGKTYTATCLDGTTFTFNTYVVDNLTSTTTTGALSANQGKILNDKKVSRFVSSKKGAKIYSASGDKYHAFLITNTQWWDSERTLTFVETTSDSSANLMKTVLSGQDIYEVWFDSDCVHVEEMTDYPGGVAMCIVDLTGYIDHVDSVNKVKTGSVTNSAVTMFRQVIDNNNIGSQSVSSATYAGSDSNNESLTVNANYCTGSVYYKGLKLKSNRRLIHLCWDITFKSSYSSDNVAVISDACPVPLAGGSIAVSSGTSAAMGALGLVCVDSGRLRPWYCGTVSGHWVGSMMYIST